LGLLATLITIPFLSAFAFWIVLVAFIILMLGTLIKGM
jgi:heme/copper-type cytochrome/quinol oxidase subunit 1